MMNNMDNNIAEEQKETKSLAEIMESFGKAFLKLWWIAVILMVVAGFLGYYKYRTGYTPMYQSEVTFSILLRSMTDRMRHTQITISWHLL